MRRLRSALLILLTFGCGVRLSQPGAASPQASGGPCVTAKDCPRPGDPCFVAACADGFCQSQVAAAGLVPADQKAGDCQELVCDGRGRSIPREDQNDVPASDDNDCTEERCSSGEPEHGALGAGVACGAEGVCNGGGICGVCVPGKLRCDGNAAETCEPRGQWSDPAACQGHEPVCSRGACAGIGPVALGAHHTCVPLSDGTARCWGGDRAHQIEGQNRRRVALGGVLELALGEDHTCARLAGGGVRCWGTNVSGELGDGSGEDQAMPVEVVGLRGATQIAAGAGHTCARLEDGTVVCWGRDKLGQLGDGSPAGPVPSQPTQPPSQRKVAALSSRLQKAVVTALSPMIQLSLGGDRTCARYQDLTADCWGDVDFHPRATPPSHGGPSHGTPVRPSQGAPVRPGPSQGAPVRPGPSQGAPVRPGAPPLHAPGGTQPPLHAPGGTRPPLHAPGGAQPTPTPKFKLVKGLKGVAQIATGGDHTCARLADGSIQCWGDNAKGQLGDGSASARHTPTKIRGLAGVAEVVLGRDHTCARLQDGTVQCWGSNSAGQLGDGSRADRKVPAPVSGLTGAISLAAGGDRTCARLASGEVKCWGDNAEGALGDGTAEDRPAPTAVTW